MPIEGVHVGLGAFEINSIASVSAMFFASLWYLGYTKTRNRYMLYLSVGWIGLCFYWGMIAVTSGPKPLWGRADLTLPIRLTLLVSIIILIWGKFSMMVTAWRLRPTGPIDADLLTGVSLPNGDE